MRPSAGRTALAGTVIVAAVILGGCTGAPGADGGNPTDLPAASITPSPEVSVTAAAPSSWAEVTPDAGSPSSSSSATPTPAPGSDDLEGDVQGELLEDWRIGDARVSLGTEPNPDGVVDTEEFYEQRFGDLGPSDGLDISPEHSSTSAGAPLLIVDVEPAAGQGGDAQTLVYILGPDTIVSGVLTYDGGLDQTQRSQLVDRSKAVELGS